VLYGASTDRGVFQAFGVRYQQSPNAGFFVHEQRPRLFAQAGVSFCAHVFLNVKNKRSNFLTMLVRLSLTRWTQAAARFMVAL
jgi:hypothetical protein